MQDAAATNIDNTNIPGQCTSSNRNVEESASGACAGSAAESTCTVKLIGTLEEVCIRRTTAERHLLRQRQRSRHLAPRGQCGTHDRCDVNVRVGTSGRRNPPTDGAGRGQTSPDPSRRRLLWLPQDLQRERLQDASKLKGGQELQAVASR